MSTFKIFSLQSMLKKIFLLSCLFLFVSCDTRFNLPECPSPIPENPPPECVRLALVLGGGGTKGMAHVGVLEEFEKAGIQIDLLVGCSAGSIVSVLYADCPHAHRIKKLLKPLKKWDVLDISIWQGRYGLVQGGSLRGFLKRHLSCKYLEELQIPVCIAATDLIRGELVCINSGLIIPAVHASSAVPLVFTPVLLYDRLLVDGGVADPVPVQLAKKMGAVVIVAVDLSAMLEKTCPKNLFGVASRSAEIKFLLQSESCVSGADVVIRPDLGCMGMFDDTDLEKTYEAGRKAAEELIPEILEILSQKCVNKTQF
ncbi:MAG: patatin-like phospholipase family protein [Parachlamydiaceae bacterium]|nr:patatin-like phospholipase family protein [Parachlamydiaceae bacterium]